ncbi:putative zinc transporter ZIP10-like [Apostichopus japonicus]|uniref:Putative zinc transporter ZIP10-like n=1 Tax=Stichopus japonicus TaxID=307972 RepID=A0A2G8L9C6_STIJA|nr:putative zinc transporter ZIP10-like [Apostichopus japonicus]
MGPAAGDCLQVIFHRYGNANSITFGRFREFVHNIGLGFTETDAEHDHHQHSNGATGTAKPSTLTDPFSSMFGDKHTTDAHVRECLSPASLLAAIGLHPTDTLNSSRFLQLCPILLQQIDIHACQGDHHDHGDVPTGGDSRETRDMREVWGFATAAVTVISLSSLICILTVPCIQGHPVAFQRLLAFLVALAVGTLSGDAVLHLIPHSFIPHNHDVTSHENAEGDGHHGSTDAHVSTPSSTEREVIFKGLVVLLGIFTFFVFEQLLQYISEKSGSAGRKQEYRSLPTNQDIVGLKLAHQERREEDKPVLSPSSMDSGTKSDQAEQLSSLLRYSTPSSHVKELPEGGGNVIEMDKDVGDMERTHLQSGGPSSEVKIQGHGHSHGHSHGFVSGEGISSLAWVVVLGDALHNLCDGLVVGSAFVDSLTGGISTSIAIMCHEIPHELGDFAVMLKAGMSIKQALAVQGVSSVLAYVGMALGVAVGNITSASVWMFAFAAGMFLYIALVDLIPEMVESTKSSEDSRILQFGLQAAGVTLGFGIMLTIALCEMPLLVLLGG